MSSAAECVFATAELLDQILKDVNPSDIFVFQRVNKTFRQTIHRTSHLRQRRLARICHTNAESNAAGEVRADWALLFASRFFLSFLVLEPFIFQRCSVLTDPLEQQPMLHLQYSYIPRSAIASRLWTSERAYPHTANIAMRRGSKMYEVSPSWAGVWLPDAVIRISLHVYRHEHKHNYTETTQLDREQAEMRSVAMALDTLAQKSERQWASGKIWGEWTI